MRIKAILAIYVVSTVVMFAGAKGAGLPKTAEIVPAETLFLVNIRDFNQLRAKFEKSSIYRLYKEPSMAAFVESFTEKVRAKIAKEDDSVWGINKILDTNGLPEGTVALAFVFGANAGPEQEPSFLLIGQWGRNIDRVKDVLDKLAAQEVEKGAHRSIETYRDVNIITLTTELPPRQVQDWENYNEQDGNVPMKTVQPPPEKDAFCFLDDCLIVGNDVETVKFVVAHIKGATGAALAGDGDYVSVMSETGPYHDIDIYFNVKQFIKRMSAEDKTGEFGKEMSNLGLDGVAGLGCSLGIETEGGGALSGKAFLKTSGTKRGILKMLETRTEAVRFPRFIPASAYSVGLLNVDIKRAFDEFLSVLYGFEPAAAMGFQQPIIEAGAEGEPAVTLRADIIEYLGSQIVFSQSIKKPFAAGAEPTENLIAIAISNRVALEKSLSRVHKQLIAPNNPEPTRELLGHTIYMMGPAGFPILGGEEEDGNKDNDDDMMVPANFGVMGAVEQPPGPRSIPAVSRLAFTITDTHLILGQEGAVERAIRTIGGAESESISSAEWFNSAKSAVPSVAGLASFENTAASCELLWWMLKESTKNKRANMGMGPAAVFAGPDFQELADFSLLPPFETVRKYFGYTASYGITRSDGILIEVKYLNPRKTGSD